MHNRENIIEKHGNKLKIAQDYYDMNTEHGTNVAQQTRWNNLLDIAILHKQTQVGSHSL